MSWIQEQQDILQMKHNYCREPMNTIVCCFLYVNKEHNLEKVTCETISLEPFHTENSIYLLSKEYVLQLIYQKKIHTPQSKYIFKSHWLYLVDLEPENILHYSKNENFEQTSSRFMHIFHTIEDISIVPSIFIFHSLNMLYFLFQEVPTQFIPKPILKIGQNLTSILSNHTSSSPKQNKKKVTIKHQPYLQLPKMKPKQTRKMLINKP